MNLRELLAQVPGLNRRFVYYLEAKGVITPAKVRKERIARRDFSQEDLKMVQAIWGYYQRGYSLQVAHELATKAEREVAYLAVPAPYRELPRVFQRLQEHAQIVEASAVYGSTASIMLKIETPHEADLYQAIPFLAEIGISGLPEITRAKATFRRGAGHNGREAAGMLAYVVMKVPGKQVDQVMQHLKQLPQVQEASTVYGESDIIAKVLVPDQEALDTLVMEQLHRIPAVESTRTFIVIKGLHWER